jgi:site-specific DNA-methyltransferase (adenine-specific)
MSTLIITNEDNIALMARYPDNYFDLAIVDPPYGIERFKKVTSNPSIKDVHARRFQRMETVNNNKPTLNYWDELFRVSKNQIIWGANNFEMPPSEYFLCWNKEQAMPNFATLEYAWVSMGLKKPAKLFTYSIHKHNQINKIHPTQKPVKLYEWLLMNYAKPGDKILDTHLGSGSIAIACHNLGFDLTACELDSDYYNAALKRINDHKLQIRLF